VDRTTVAAYERYATEYATRRTPRNQREARAFAGRVPTGRWRADLGSGPARYTGDLGRPVVAVDAAWAMLELVGDRAPAARRVQGDLEALPFRRGALAGAWANLSYQHVPRARLPLALAHLHEVLGVGAPAEITVIAGEGDGPWPDDEFPGRYFARWSSEDLANLLTGAGFDIESVAIDGDHLRARVTRLHTLPDVVGPGMRVLVCGLNPSPYAAEAGISFARPGNRFWPAAVAAGIVSAERDPWAALARHGVGLTDLVKRVSPGAAELTAAEYRAGGQRLAWLVHLLQPGAVCFVGLAGWRAAVNARATPGPQAEGFAGVPAYLSPSTSGRNAHESLASLSDHLRRAAALSRNP